MQRHHTPIANRIASTEYRVDVGGEAGIGVEPHQPTAKRSYPDSSVGCVSERGDELVCEPRRPTSTEFPTTGVPAADAARARADPDEAGRVLVQRHHERIAQRLCVARVVMIVGELAGRAVEKIQPVSRTHPQVTGLILEEGPDLVSAERRLAQRIMAEYLHDAPVALHACEAAIEGSHPKRSAAVLEHTGNLIAAKCARIGRPVTEVREAAAGQRPVEAGLGADPDGPGTIERKGINAVAAQRGGTVRLVAQMLDAPRGGVQ